MDNAAKMGKFFLRGFKVLEAKYPHIIKEARGLGMMMGIEMKEREPAIKAAKGMFDKGVLVAHTMNNPNVIRIEPPLMIGQSDIEKVLQRFDEVLKAL
jgi:putrescine aminotransferase